MIKSFFKAIDPRIKLLSYLIFIVIIFLPIGNTGLIILFLLLAIVAFLIPIKAKRLLILLFNWFIIFFIVAFFNFLIVGVGELGTFQIGNLTLNWNSLYVTYSVMLRIGLLLFLALIFSTIMALDELAFTINKLLFPLKKLKIPTDNITIIFTIAIRFMPIIADDLHQINMAQKTHGISLKNPLNFFGRIKAYVISLRLLLILSLEKADNLALSMENRGFKINQPRSYFERHQLGIKDLIYSFSILLILGFFIFMAIEGGDLIPRFGDVSFWIK